MREDLNDAWLRYLGVSGESDRNTKATRINTEEVIKENVSRARVGEGPPTTRHESETSETTGTGTLFDTCTVDGCTVSLWHPESRQTGICAKCKKAGEAA
jgi:hypothetical protein